MHLGVLYISSASEPETLVFVFVGQQHQAQDIALWSLRWLLRLLLNVDAARGILNGAKMPRNDV
jgi:hypothetical protein